MFNDAYMMVMLPMNHVGETHHVISQTEGHDIHNKDPYGLYLTC